ncbi:MAG: TerC family protein, partial [Patescibacteria group bacterium]
VFESSLTTLHGQSDLCFMTMLQLLMDPQTYLSLLFLSVIEILLGVDNAIMVVSMADRLPVGERVRVRNVGFLLAMVVRIMMLCGASWLIGLTSPVLTIFSMSFSWKDLILLGGGLFLIWKAVEEIHREVVGDHGNILLSKVKKSTFWMIIGNIVLLDVVFSIDSVITAAGMANHLAVMITVVVIAVMSMITIAGPLADFLKKHPDVKILALSFLVVIGCVLTMEGFHKHIEKEYIYFAMGFAMLVEMIQLWRQKNIQTPERSQFIHSQYLR